MADTILTLKQLEDAFYNLTCTVLGLDPLDPNNLGLVRIAFPEDGAPAWGIDDNIVFIQVTAIDNKLARGQDIIYTGNDNVSISQQTGYTRVHKVAWSLYGPNAYDNADLLRYNLFSQTYTTQLLLQNLFLITDVPMPQRTPELYNGQWWERTDFYAEFNELVIRESVIPNIASPNFVIIEDK
jgi:hypothetical protein